MNNKLQKYPPTWLSIHLENLFEWSNGKNLTQKQMQPGSYYVYGGNGLSGMHSNWLCAKEAIVIGRVGANCGNVHLVPPKSWVTDNAIYSSWGTKNINLNFFSLQLSNLKLNELAGGSGQPYISQTILNQLVVCLPPLAEQRRIVAKIEALTARSRQARAHLAAIPPLLEKFRQSVLAAAFRGDLTAEWRTQNPTVEPAAILLERIRAERRQCWEEAELAKMRAKGKEPLTDDWKAKYQEPEPVDTSDLPELPEGWTWSNIENLAEVVRGASPRPAGDPKYFGGNIPWITVAEITKDDNLYLEKVSSFLTEEGKSRSRFIEEGTFLLTNSGATLGVPKISHISGCINDGSVAFIDIPLTSNIYLYYFLKGQTQKLRKINQGAAQPNLNTDIVKNILVPLAPLEEQKEIAQQVESLFKIANKVGAYYQQAQNQLDQLDQAILAKAFRGELVPQDPNDEPASVLLARIQAERTANTEARKPKQAKAKASATIAPPTTTTSATTATVATTVATTSAASTPTSATEPEATMVQMELFE